VELGIYSFSATRTDLAIARMTGSCGRSNFSDRAAVIVGVEVARREPA
jgi:hypothetical protein